MTAGEVITLLRSLHRETTWTWMDDTHSVMDSWQRRGCITCHAHLSNAQSNWATWPCESAALLDQIERVMEPELDPVGRHHRDMQRISEICEEALAADIGYMGEDGHRAYGDALRDIRGIVG